MISSACALRHVETAALAHKGFGLNSWTNAEENVWLSEKETSETLFVMASHEQSIRLISNEDAEAGKDACDVSKQELFSAPGTCAETC